VLSLRIIIWINANRFDPLSHKNSLQLTTQNSGFIGWPKSLTHAHTSPCCCIPRCSYSSLFIIIQL